MSRRVLCLSLGSQSGAGSTTLLPMLHAKHGAGWEFFVVTQERGPLTEELDRLKVRYWVLKMRGWRKWRYFFHNLLTVLRLVAIARSEKIDLIYCLQWRLNPYALRVARRTGIPFISHVRDIFHQPRPIKRFGLDRADLVIVPSAAAQRPFMGVPVKTAIVHHGVDLAYFQGGHDRGEIRREFSLKDHEVLIGVVARLTPQKGLEDLVRAAACLKARAAEIRFLVVGDNMWKTGMTIEGLKAFASRLGVGNMVFAGRRHDIPRILSGLDIFVLPSWTESFSLALVEAMAMGKAVVATSCGGPEEIVRDNIDGLLVPVRSPDLLAAALIRLVDDPGLRVRLACEARKTVEKKFSLTHYVANMEKMFLSLLSGRDQEGSWRGEDNGA